MKLLVPISQTLLLDRHNTDMKIKELTKICENCSIIFNNNKFEASRKDWEKRRYCSRKCYSLAGREFTKEHRENLSKAKLGKTFTREHRERISSSLKNSKLAKLTQFKKGEGNPMYGKGYLQTGENNPYWRGGSSENQRIRNAPEYVVFRKFCMSRDKFKCSICYTTRHLHVHHIKSISTHPQLAYDNDNGQTVCIDCHEKIHGRKINIKYK